ncbi:hypothetical protein ASPZODRAFT_134633 [Penicilliopsis zonata CBS 506.65]|uniref:Peptidase S7 domain-containing protein n=1 Tax=Penicilliopsis zonata CBS 506.65 TaxID=1073090 RepID=A0A1L9SBJ5_9EURO|nr:hypothetical protein ASPZODRAFT_134633 [Penicilliopsis zonata CBS 506.65]OJJ44552.1 hypothetical protein ASPZODRAFT_134633 [Penicilliopsis zonata CBS 506.65]
MDSSNSPSRSSRYSEFSSSTPITFVTPDSLHSHPQRVDHPGSHLKTLGSSLDDWVPTIEGFINEDRRVGGPVLCPLPVVSVAIHHTDPEFVKLSQAEPQLSDHITSIVQRHGIDFIDIDITRRLSKLNPQTSPVPTVVIFANQHQINHSWLDAAKEIHRFLLSKNFANFQVEIVDPVILKPWKCFPVLDTDQVFSHWDNLRDRILNSFNLHEWISLECYRFGKEDVSSKNPPCVVVSVKPDSSTNWTPTRDRIIAMLDEYALSSSVGVYIIPDVIFKSIEAYIPTKELLSDSAFQLEAQAGTSIGLHLPGSPSGTLGGFIELQWSGSPEWKQFGLTCFHCVYPKGFSAPFSPQDNFVIDQWYDRSVRPNDPNASRLMRLCQPSLGDMEGQVAYLADGIRNQTSDKESQAIEQALEQGEFVLPFEQKALDIRKLVVEKLEARKMKVETFLSSTDKDLGPVFAGSGYQVFRESVTMKSVEKTILDWALVEIVQARKSQNNTFSFAPDLLVSDVHTGRPAELGTLCKSGRTTKHTKGQCAKLRQAKIARYRINGMEEIKATLEHSVTGDFSEPGDSGSIVLDGAGRVVGLLFGGCQNKTASYFTHVRDLVKDIREVTGASGVRIMGCDVRF